MSLDGSFLNATEAPDTLMNTTMDWIMNKMDQFPIKMSFLFACSMVLGSVVPYIPQYFTIKQTQNTEGFSLYVCLTLLVANILRIMFWFGKRFETALLVQSIVMILAMFGLLELCVRVRNSNLIIQGRKHYFAGGDASESKEKSAAGDGEVEGKKKILLVNGAAIIDDHHNDHHQRTGRSSVSSEQKSLRAVSNNTVSSTVIEHIVIPNPHSILTQLPNAVSEPMYSSSRSPGTPKQATPATNTSTISLSSNSSTSSPTSSPNKRSSASQQHNSSNTQPENVASNPLCAASLSHHSATSSSSVSECPPHAIGVAREDRPKQTETATKEGDTADTADIVVDCDSKCKGENGKCAKNGVEGEAVAGLLEKEGSLKMSIKKSASGGQMATVKYSTEEEDTRVQVEYQGRLSPTATSPTTAAALVPDHQVVTVLAASVADELPAKRRLLDFDLKYFWEWTDFISYLECMAIFAFFTGLIMFFFINEPLVVESYGFVALVTESLLASPQFYKNFKAKSTEGMSRMMVFTWFLGDLYKTIYFVTRAAPFQFLLCGFTQITFDCLIFLQIIWYKKANYRMLSKSRTKHLEENARKMREEKMLNLINSMEEDGGQGLGTNSAEGTVTIIEHGHCNPLDDTMVAQMQPLSNSSSSSKNICSVRVIENKKGAGKKGKKASLELVSLSDAGDGGYVNELALATEQSNLKDNTSGDLLIDQEYQMEEEVVDSDDSSQCDLQPNTKRKL